MLESQEVTITDTLACMDTKGNVRNYMQGMY